MNIVSENIENYCINHSNLPSELCRELGNETKEKHPLGRMISGELVSSFIGFMIHSLGVKNILEIGTFTGYSALSMAEQIPEDGKVITIDKNKKINSYASSFWDRSEHGHKIQALFGDANEVINKLEDKFDLIFIDADKGSYENYVKKSLPLLSTRGIIVVDNVLWSGKVCHPQNEDEDKSTTVLRDFNSFINSIEGIYKTIVPIRDGLYLIKKIGQ